jgi:hypothetical protein
MCNSVSEITASGIERPVSIESCSDEEGEEGRAAAPSELCDRERRIAGRCLASSRSSLRRESEFTFERTPEPTFVNFARISSPTGDAASWSRVRSSSHRLRSSES